MNAVTRPYELARSSDQDLARRMARGDASALEEVMRAHNQKLFRTARAILRDDAAAEDVLQEAYLRAYRSIDTFRGEAKLSTWLVRIVANEALMRRRKEQRRAQVVPIHGGAEPDVEGCMDQDEGPAELAERGEIRRLLEQRIDALPDAFRTVFVLRALEELSVEETAKTLGIAAATVRTRFFRARSLLRDSLSREIDFAFGDAFTFDGERCDRIVACVLAAIGAGTGTAA